MTRFLAGLASGLLIAYLTAPTPGRQTRTRLTQSTKRQLAQLNQLQREWHKTVDQINRLLEVVELSTGLRLSTPRSRHLT